MLLVYDLIIVVITNFQPTCFVIFISSNGTTVEESDGTVVADRPEALVRHSGRAHFHLTKGKTLFLCYCSNENGGIKRLINIAKYLMKTY